MKRGQLAICGLFASTLLYGQGGFINVTASKVVELPPEEATFNLAVLTEQDAMIDQVLQAVKDISLANKDLTGIGTYQYGPSPTQSRLAFQFALTVPFSKFKETLDKFAALRRSLLANSTEMELQTYFIAIAATDAAREQARQRTIPDLIQDARKKAEFLASAAGQSLGAIEEITDSASVSGAVGVPGPFFSPASLKTTFVLTVRFSIR